MKITISEYKSLPEYIQITRAEYIELKSKAERYDQRKTLESLHIKHINNNRSSAERKELARKAAAARWNKPNHMMS